MAIAKDMLKELIILAFPKADVEVSPLSDDDDHYVTKIACTSFAGKTMIEQHRMVYQALGPKMGNELHALSIKTSVKKDT